MEALEDRCAPNGGDPTAVWESAPGALVAEGSLVSSDWLTPTRHKARAAQEKSVPSLRDYLASLGTGASPGRSVSVRPVQESVQSSFDSDSRDSVALLALSDEVRTYDGWGNNLANPTWGAANTQLLRNTPVDYGDGMASPAGADRPSARAISNAVLAQSGSILSSRHLSAFVFQWGQFLDHDLDLSGAASPAEFFPIPVPAGDPFFDPLNTGAMFIPLSRSIYDLATGTSADNPRQQLNQITSYIDGSMIYGSDAARALALRTLEGGKLKTSDGDLLPYNTLGLPNGGPPGSDPAAFFVAGDVRVNEQIGLTAMHTLFVREHNWWAERIATQNPTFSEEEIYQEARRIVTAEIQVITYNEFLPAVLGPNYMTLIGPYTGYDPTVNASVSNIFSTAAFRVGHTMLPSQLLRLDDHGEVIPEGNIALRDAFFSPSRITGEGGIDPILKGLASQVQQEIDAKIVDEVRNFLFGPPGAGGFDLASLNIQRGRDHGLPSYNETRIAFGLAPVTSFAQITADVSVQRALASVYGDVNQIDAWVGGISEDHMRGSSLGPLFTAIWVDQFTRARDGDRYWYQNDPAFTPAERALLGCTTLSDIVRRNTRITNLQPNVFFVHGAWVA
jgi:hypothetical protein